MTKWKVFVELANKSEWRKALYNTFVFETFPAPVLPSHLVLKSTCTGIGNIQPVKSGNGTSNE